MAAKANSQMINKHVLENDLDLRQLSRSIIFTKGNLFVLSPSAQNEYNWFDLRRPNLERYQEKPYRGFLLVRFFDKLLVTELEPFVREMMPDDKFVFTKTIGPHWKFRIVVKGNNYSIYNQQNSKKLYPIRECSVQELKILIR
ncbi:hypothetical protein HNQ44_001696 [Planomicrobium koreense]|uniref:Uncharacterized protein n=1 Tax=Planococcus koreensis TaxID=112331 RepID=A0A7W8CRH6_9BACL|nr:hypothetical protein [Planococcus koreensis]MBB5180268.1 hypothetical protein [Planococcus koreensis]